MRHESKETRSARRWSVAVLSLAALGLLLALMGGDGALHGGRTQEAATRSDAQAAPSGRRAVSAAARALQGAPAKVEGSLAGTITGSDGRPLAGATVCAVCSTCDSTLPGNRPLCTQAGPDGSYALLGARSGAYRLSVGARGHEMKAIHGGAVVRVDTEHDDLDGLDAELDEGGVVIAGVVTDATGGPVDGALVQANSMLGEGAVVAQTTTSDPSGAFALTISPGPVRLVAVLDGYAPADVTRYAPAADVRLVVTPASTIRGHVVDGGGAPVAGAQVWARSTGRETLAESDAQGAFAFGEVRPGTYFLEAVVEGARGHYPQPVTLDLLDAADGIEIVVDAAAVVTGTVSIEDAPCAFGEVRMQAERPGPASMQYARSDADGKLVFDAVPSGTYRTTARCVGTGLVDGPTIEVAGAPLTGIVWRIPRGGELEVVVVDASGSVLGDVPVRVQLAPVEPSGAPATPRQQLTDDDGRHVFAGLPPGRYRVSAPGLGTPQFVEVDGTQPARAVLALNAAGFVDVSVRRPDGTPNDEVAVSAVPSPVTPRGDVGHPRGEGHYRVGPIAVGQYVIEVRDGINPVSRTESPVAVVAGQTTAVAFTLGQQTGLISGQVVDTGGRPLPNVWVSAVHAGAQDDGYGHLLQDTTQAAAREVLSDGQGAFTIPELEASGTFTVTATRPLGGRSVLENVHPGQQVSITLASPATLAGTVVAPDDVRLDLVEVRVTNPAEDQLLVQSFTDATGTWRIDGVAPGEVTIQVASPGIGSGMAELRIAPGSTVEGITIALDTPPATLVR